MEEIDIWRTAKNLIDAHDGGAKLQTAIRADHAMEQSHLSALFSSSETKLVGAKRAMASPQILIVEDEAPLCKLLAGMLAENDFEVVTAGNGVEALELLNAHPSIQLVLSDVLMPRMNGYEFVERALGLRPELKVLIMTAYVAEMPLPTLLQAREIRTLQKPFDVIELCDLLDDMLSQP